MKILRYKSIDEFKDIISMTDFYERTGILYKEDPNDKKFKCIAQSVSQIYMDEEDGKQLLEFLKANQKLQKDRTLRHCSKKYYENSVGFDWLNYSPSCKVKVPKGEIWLDI